MPKITEAGPFKVIVEPLSSYAERHRERNMTVITPSESKNRMSNILPNEAIIDVLDRANGILGEKQKISILQVISVLEEGIKDGIIVVPVKKTGYLSKYRFRNFIVEVFEENQNASIWHSTGQVDLADKIYDKLRDFVRESGFSRD